MASSRGVLCLLFLLFLANASNARTPPNATEAATFLKLPLLRTSPFPSPTQALAQDSLRLSRLSLRRKGRAPVVESPVVSGASWGSGQYFVNLRLGDPPQPLLLVADTGSDLVWVKCSACRNCSLHPPHSAFFARHSRSLSLFHCYDPVCKLVPHPRWTTGCKRARRIHTSCKYQYSYADGSVSEGLLALETTTLRTSSGRQAEIRNVAFGCGFRISGRSFSGAQGVMGLGRGATSFSSQLGRSFGQRFSYCLMDYTLSPPPASFLVIGRARYDDVLGNPNFGYTPLIANPLSPTFYYVQIKSVYVNRAKLRIDPSAWSLDEYGNGGTVIDSGTTLSFLAKTAYRRILRAFTRHLSSFPMPNSPTPGFDLCVNATVPSRSFPRLSFKLAGGAIYTPPPRNYFIETETGVTCLAIQPVDSAVGFSVIGNLMQQGFLFEFDGEASRVGFTRRGCGSP